MAQLTDRTAYSPDVPSLKEVFRNRLRIGAAVNTWDLEPEAEAGRVIRKQFGILTLENESKPLYVHPEEDRYFFDRFDKFVRFGEENGIALRGHTLVWHGQCPGWFFRDGDSDASHDLLLSRMKEHIKTVVSRYRGRVAVWDVLNEVLRDEGGLRESRWYRIAGEDYIPAAFFAACEADPDARLVINDYNLESSEAKADTMAALVESLIRNGVPVDAVGLQMHLNLYTDMELLKKNVRKLAELRRLKPDFKLEVTELDLSCYRWGDNAEDLIWTEEHERAFREKYAALFRFYLELSEEGILDSVVFWGLNDGVSWLNGFPVRRRNYPLLIGRNNLLKPAFFDVAGL
ncbi:MAG: endo-1,4-beta-xylanase [Ruminococcaceae bacterium]|jgi:endo-1,4-beta-xylanase|nr:endo-1,4-beta-xylanase [Oscillospiraceae bacterium]